MKIAFDTEFSYNNDNELQPMCLAVTEEDGTTRTWWRDELDKFKAYALKHGKTTGDIWVCHNCEMAEGQVFMSLELDPTDFIWHDTMISSIVIYNTDSKKIKYDLLSCLKREGIATEREHDEKVATRSVFIYEPTKTTWEQHLAALDSDKDNLTAYCLADTEDLIELDNRLCATFEDPDKFRCDEDVLIGEKGCILARGRIASYFGFLAAFFAKSEWQGIPLNVDRVDALRNNAKEALVAEQMRFNEAYPGTFRLEKNKLTKCTNVCRDYAIKCYKGEYGSGVVAYTAKGNVSLAKKDTKPYSKRADKNFLGDYYRYSKVAQSLNSFTRADRSANHLGMFVKSKGVIRPTFGLLRAVTGRCGMKPSTGFVYTMPKFVRGLVDPPEGWVLMEFDYASQEIGVQAYITGDKTKADMYEHPKYGKYYCDIAHSFWPDFVSKEDRRYKTAKQMALMTEYGCGAEKLASCAGVKYKVAEKFIVHMRKLFPSYWKYVDKLIAKIIDRNKRAWFPDGFGVTASKDARPTTFGNLPFQGTGSYILRRICVELYKAKIRLVAPVHDAVIVMCKEDEREEVANKVKAIMEKASKDATGTLIKVGDPEVTYHGLVNCHSELETREDYTVKLPEKLASTEDYDAREYYNEYERYVGSYLPKTTIDFATNDMYVDEEFYNGKENNNRGHS